MLSPKRAWKTEHQPRKADELWRWVHCLREWVGLLPQSGSDGRSVKTELVWLKLELRPIVLRRLVSRFFSYWNGNVYLTLPSVLVWCTPWLLQLGRTLAGGDVCLDPPSSYWDGTLKLTLERDCWWHLAGSDAFYMLEFITGGSGIKWHGINFCPS